MVYEIDMNHNVAHIKSIERPIATLESAPKVAEPIVEDPAEPWPASFVTRLSPLMSEETIEGIKELFLASPMQPPLETATDPSDAMEKNGGPDPGTSLPTKFGSTRGGRQKGKGKSRESNKAPPVDDKRKVVSNVSPMNRLLRIGLRSVFSPSPPRSNDTAFTKLSGNYLVGSSRLSRRMLRRTRREVHALW
jgi:hypothetical protein